MVRVQTDPRRACPRSIVVRTVVIASALVLAPGSALLLAACGQGSPSAGAAAPTALETTAVAGAAAAAPSSAAAASPDPSGTKTTAPTKEASPTPPVPTTPAPSATKPQAAKPTKAPTPTPTPSRTVAAPCFTVGGKVARTTTFTVAQLKAMATFSGTYFSRGKDPKEATNTFVGVRLIDILKAAGRAADAARVTVTAADGYSAGFSLRQVTADYIDETRPGVTLPMIVAYSEDGIPYTGAHPFRLVMGQAVEGDYNRQYWVRLVTTITVQ